MKTITSLYNYIKLITEYQRLIRMTITPIQRKNNDGRPVAVLHIKLKM